MQQGLGLMGRETSLLCKETGVHSSARKAHPSLSPEQKQSLKPQTPTWTNTGNRAIKHREDEHKTKKKGAQSKEMVLAGSALPEHTQVLPEGILIYLQQELHVRGKKVATAALQSIKYLVGRQFISLQG